MYNQVQSSQVLPYSIQPQLTQSISYTPNINQLSSSQIIPSVSYTPQASQVYPQSTQLSTIYNQTPQISQIGYSARAYQPSPPYAAYIPPTPVPRRFLYY